VATVFVDFHQNKLFFLFVDSTWPKTGDVWTPWNGLTPTVQAVRRSGVREVEHLLSWVKDRSTLRKTRSRSTVLRPCSRSILPAAAYTVGRYCYVDYNVCHVVISTTATACLYPPSNLYRISHACHSFITGRPWAGYYFW